MLYCDQCEYKCNNKATFWTHRHRHHKAVNDAEMEATYYSQTCDYSCTKKLTKQSWNWRVLLALVFRVMSVLSLSIKRTHSGSILSENTNQQKTKMDFHVMNARLHGSIPDRPFPLCPSHTEGYASLIQKGFPFDLWGLSLGVIRNVIQFSRGSDFEKYILNTAFLFLQWPPTYHLAS